MSPLPGIRWLKRRRSQGAFRDWARARGLAYAARDDSWLTAYPSAFPLAEGSRHRLVDVVSGRYRGHAAVFCTHRFRGEYGREDVGVYSIDLPRTVPNVQVRRRTVATLGSARHDFDARYTVDGDDAAFTASVLSPTIRSWLLDSDASGFELAGNRIFVRGDSQLDIPRIAFWLDYLEALVQRLEAVTDPN